MNQFDVCHAIEFQIYGDAGVSGSYLWICCMFGLRPNDSNLSPYRTSPNDDLFIRCDLEFLRCRAAERIDK